MMKKIQLLALAIILITAWSCDTTEPPVDFEGTGTLSLEVKANFDGAPLFSDQVVVLPDGKIAKFAQFNFFISDMTVNFLEEGTAKITDLSEVEFVELTQTTGTPLEPTDNTFQFFQLPEGDYTSLDFTLGLAKTLNDKSPADQDLGDGSPLRRSSHYWSAWGSYIFMKLEGNIDYNDNGELEDNETILFHTGSDNSGNGDDRTAHQSVNLPYEFNITKDQTTTITISLDILDILYNEDGSQKWDLENRNSIDNLENFDLIEEAMESAANSFKMEQ